MTQTCFATGLLRQMHSPKAVLQRHAAARWYHSWIKSSPVPGLPSWQLWLGILSQVKPTPGQAPQCCPILQLPYWPSIGCSLCFVLPKGPCQCWAPRRISLPSAQFCPRLLRRSVPSVTLHRFAAALWKSGSCLHLLPQLFHRFPLPQALHLPGNISGKKKAALKHWAWCTRCLKEANLEEVKQI